MNCCPSHAPRDRARPALPVHTHSTPRTQGSGPRARHQAQPKNPGALGASCSSPPEGPRLQSFPLHPHDSTTGLGVGRGHQESAVLLGKEGGMVVGAVVGVGGQACTSAYLLGQRFLAAGQGSLPSAWGQDCLASSPGWEQPHRAGAPYAPGTPVCSSRFLSTRALCCMVLLLGVPASSPPLPPIWALLIKCCLLQEAT